MEIGNTLKNITVIRTTNHEKGKKKWNKKYCCFNCEKPFSKLPQHLESILADEEEVLQLIVMKTVEKEKSRELILNEL